MLRQLRKDGRHALRLRYRPDNDVQVIEARGRRRTRHDFVHSKHPLLLTPATTLLREAKSPHVLIF